MSREPSRVRAADTGGMFASDRGALEPGCRAALAASIASAVLSGCATPAIDVKVPSSSMDEAYRASVGAFAGAPHPAAARVVATTIRPDRPAPIVAVPDIRLAFLYQWVDTEGNLHYPSWVAIPVEAFRWVVPELAPEPAGRGTVPLDGSRAQPPPADPLPGNRDGGPAAR